MLNPVANGPLEKPWESIAAETSALAVLCSACHILVLLAGDGKCPCGVAGRRLKPGVGDRNIGLGFVSASLNVSGFYSVSLFVFMAISDARGIPGPTS